ncbi:MULTISPECIES: DUF1507 family protein [Vagococcus]|uniref:Uncharacterized protein n=1 Tax=Vagococcus teuberi TaxID=519472 RepID=A0A1J0A4T9_9ENTE|nr:MULTISPECIES: DUF1507 family protein [Vagococcus]APB30960.1 hypothetical protein BHY08_03400 [Vagococcus teuberi]RHH69519.1 DUF1507 family protein [Vagococcus sp. AM17-17]
MLEISKESILSALTVEANKIKHLLTNQRNHQCIAQCKAFEEVVDTQMFGFSKQVEFAQSIGLINRQEGLDMIIELEKELNKVYNMVYQEEKDAGS